MSDVPKGAALLTEAPSRELPEGWAQRHGWNSWEDVMRLAMHEAERGASLGEVPVGALLLDKSGAVIARAHNGPIGLNDPTAHAEIRCLREAGMRRKNYRIEQTTMVVTLEPCLMCVGALAHARIKTLIFGAYDPRGGAVMSQLRGLELPFLNHRVGVLDGILASECGDILRSFFRSRRKK